MAKNTFTKKKPPSKQLLAWLKAQATRLKKLVRGGWKLQSDYLQNARLQGKVLLEVRRRLEGTDLGFADWVEENTDIGVSTAYLWCDVAEWWDDLHDIWNNSNPLESTLRQVRDAIRDARQAKGDGKPGSGRRKATATVTPQASDGDKDEAADTAEEDTPDEKRWEREVAKAEAEAAEVENGVKAGPNRALYSVTVLVFTENDQTVIHQVLSDWSPISKSLLGPKQLRSVSAHVRPKDIGTLMHKLGNALEGNQPKKVRVSIEL